MEDLQVHVYSLVNTWSESFNSNETLQLYSITWWNSETRREDKVQKCNGSAMYFPVLESNQSDGIFLIVIERLLRYPFCTEIEEIRFVLHIGLSPRDRPASLPGGSRNTPYRLMLLKPGPLCSYVDFTCFTTVFVVLVSSSPSSPWRKTRAAKIHVGLNEMPTNVSWWTLRVFEPPSAREV